ncbi:MAG TPA: IS1595 family transposase, partial [Candidatus Binataceae bacterium]|nr:IS1595 family transposase [Candidatus Binataceae bacterium]
MMTLRELMETFPTDEACREFLFWRRWHDGKPHCPRCGKSETVYNIALPWKWECTNKTCRKGNAYRFSLTAGTIFENTKYPLKTWFEVLWQMLNSTKGVSAMQIQRQIGCKSYQTAWYMCHRLRASMHDPDFKQLMGIVEVNETYIGGKQKNRHANVRAKYHGGGAANTGKTTVIGAIARKGNVVCQIIDDTSIHTMTKFVRKAVSERVELIATDEAVGYSRLDYMFQHSTVDHKAGEYVRGMVH